MRLRKSVQFRFLSESKVKSLQAYLKDSNFIPNFLPANSSDIADTVTPSSSLPAIFQRYTACNAQSSHAHSNAGHFDMTCLDNILIDPILSIQQRPSKLIRAMMVYNFNQLASFDDEQTVLHLCAFIEVLHSLTLVIGRRFG